MNPVLKYTLGRMGLFLVVFLLLVPLRMNVFVALLIAVAASAVLSYFLLRSWRDEVARHLAQGSARRTAQRERLRSALAGDEDRDEDRGEDRRHDRREDRREGGAGGDDEGTDPPGRP